MFLDSGEEPALFAGRSGGGGKWVKMGRKKKRRRKKTDSKRRRRRPKPRMGFRVGGGAMRERAHAPFFPGNFASEILYILILISQTAPADDGPFRRRLPRRRRLPWSYRPRPWWWDPGGELWRGKSYCTENNSGKKNLLFFFIAKAARHTLREGASTRSILLAVEIMR